VASVQFSRTGRGVYVGSPRARPPASGVRHRRETDAGLSKLNSMLDHRVRDLPVPQVGGGSVPGAAIQPGPVDMLGPARLTRPARKGWRAPEPIRWMDPGAEAPLGAP
jgi:hypothetical protein